MEIQKSKFSLGGHLQICRFDHWIKNVFILPGLLIGISVYPQSIEPALAIKIFLGFLAAVIT
jgi:decaprenyl-phosphate phosphoribosyltransferase